MSEKGYHPTARAKTWARLSLTPASLQYLACVRDEPEFREHAGTPSRLRSGKDRQFDPRLRHHDSQAVTRSARLARCGSRRWQDPERFVRKGKGRLDAPHGRRVASQPPLFSHTTQKGGVHSPEAIGDCFTPTPSLACCR